VELEPDDKSFGMILRRGADSRALTDITSYGGWRAYRQAR
jgi:hypothetical protein